MLFNPREIQAMITLLNRTPMTQAEQLYAQGFFQRLTALCQPAEPEPGPEPRLAPEPDTSPSQKKAPGGGKEKGK